MDEQPENATSSDEKYSSSWREFIVWPVVIILLYVLSIGRLARMEYKGLIQDKGRFISKFYLPLAWAYHETFLHKPIGMYMHLWNPRYFDKDGEMH
jgi:hypothetical protein